MELLRRHNVTVLFIVPNSSHMTQALDVGVFGRCKNLIRSDTTYRVDLQQLDEVIAEDINAENTGVHLPAEKGLLLAEYILKVLRSFDQATTGDNVVNAFAQVGIRFRIPDGPNMNSRVCYVDPRTARVVVARFGPIPLVLQCQPESHRMIKISSLNSGHQSALARQLRQELAGIRAEVQRQSRRGFEKEN